MFPMPFTVSSVRKGFDDDGTYTGETVILSEEACLIAPPNSELLDGVLGPAEITDAILFIAADADIEVQDVLTDDSTDEEWVIVSPPISYYNPITWVVDHQQAKLKKHPMQ
jgi:hypothetical protein